MAEKERKVHRLHHPIVNICIILVCFLVLAGGCRPRTGNGLIIDKDFSASIATTDKLMVFVIKVEKVNPKVRKLIEPEGMTSGVIIKNEQGNLVVDTLGRCNNTAVWIKDAVITQPNQTTAIKRFRLQPMSLPPGTYILEPDVRILEYGEDAVHSMIPDGGTVGVPARNSVRFTVK